MPGGLWNRSFVLVLVTTWCGFGGYSLLGPTVPLWAVATGKGTEVAGATIGVFMATAVLTQVWMAWLPARRQGALGIGAVLLGVPALLLPTSTHTWTLLVLSALRGSGFGLFTAASSILVVDVAPARQRGRAIAIHGVVGGLAGVLGVPAAVWVTHYVSISTVFWLGGVFPLVAAAAAGAITSPRTGRAVQRSSPRPAKLPFPLLLPGSMMLTVALGGSALSTFLPQAAPVSVTALALMIFSLAGMVGRWLAAPLGDRVEPHALLRSTALVAALGMAGVALALAGPVLLSIAAAGVFGAGFGAAQNTTLLIMIQHSDSATAARAWNVAMDAGNGLGAMACGVLLSFLEYPATFAALAALIGCCAVVPRARANLDVGKGEPPVSAEFTR